MKEYKTSWNRKILIVEDETNIRDEYVEILTPKQDVATGSRRSSRSSSGPVAAAVEEKNDLNFELVCVSNAQSALTAISEAKAAGQPFTMGFFDVRLGDGMEGVELVKMIFDSDPSIYAVFVTAYHDRGVEAIHRFLGEGRAERWDYLNKPFSRGEIIQKARNFTSLWNLNRERDFREKELRTLRERIGQGEKASAVAAVARGVGHEFGNILLQIIGKAELSLNKSEQGKQEALQKILEASQRATEILDRFKSLSDHQTPSTAKAAVSLREVVDGTVDLMEHQIRVDGLKVCFVKSDSGVVYGHYTSLMQVIVNLLINASHAMGGGGQIDISIESLDQDWMCLRLRDYGPGVPEQDLEKVLQPLFTTKGREGSGLGLAICQEIVEIDHQGHFEIRNHPVKGFEVVIRLPKQELQEAA